MKILITGSDGFVGKRFCDFYKGNDITKIDIKSGLDCRDFFKTKNQKFDLIIHLAAIVGGRETIENEPLSVASDLAIDSDMFNWALKTNQERVVYFSSSAAYPINLQHQPYKLKESDIDLDNIQNPDFTYGWSKLTGEYLSKFAKQKGLKIYTFRPFSGYGEEQDICYPYPSFIQRGINDLDTFEIWGDGKQVRDFIYIQDIIQFTNRVLELDIQDVFNIGTGIPTDFIQLSEKIMRINGKRKDIILRPDKPVGCKYRCADITKMSKIYKPEFDLDDMIKLTIENEKSYLS